jgi:hypothetical protein
MYEHRREPVLGRQQFLERVSRHGMLSLIVVVASLLFGTVGYHLAAGLGWIDAFLNAAMILTGMGPVDVMTTPSAKLFAAGYALYSGIAFVAITGILLAPFVHRLLHRLHAER